VDADFVPVDVVTAVHPPYARFIPLALASLRAQYHTDWTWLIQVDGSPDGVLGALRACGAIEDPRVQVAANQTREGPAVTRNLALGRGTAPLVHNLDADDELEPDALAVLVSACQQRPRVGFAAGQVRDLLGGGALRPRRLPVAPGILPRGSLLAAWETRPGSYRLPLHPAGVLWRRSLVLQAGGWLALRGMEDTGLLMAASAMAPGFLVDVPTLRYRRHRAQRSRRRSHFAGGGGTGRAHSAAGGTSGIHLRVASGPLSGPAPRWACPAV
jgi:hypothetical protein